MSRRDVVLILAPNGKWTTILGPKLSDTINLMSQVNGAERLYILKDALKSHAAINIQTTLRSDELGQNFSFRSLEPLLRRIVEKVQMLATSTLEILSPDQVNALESELRRLNSLYAEIASFRDTNPDAKNERDQILESYLRTLGEMDGRFGHYIVYISVLGDDNQRRSSAQLAELVATFQKDIETFKHEKDGIVLAARNGVSQIGPMVHADAFASQAKKYDVNAIACLAAAGGCLALFVYVVSKIKLEQVPDNASVAKLLVTYSPQLTFPSVLILAIVLSLRFFQAERHNAIANRQKETALRTFRAFVEGSDSQQIKDAVLLQAATAIFTNQPTGYTKSPVDAGSIPGALGAAAKHASGD